MASIHSITFATRDWQAIEFKKNQKAWQHIKSKDIVSLTFFPQRPDFVANLTDLDTLRAQSEEMIRDFRGTITEFNVEQIEHVPSLYQIVKLPRLEHGHGHIYIGTYALPFQEFSYVIKIECPETTATGLRESAAISELIRDGKLKTSDIEGKVRNNQIPVAIRQLVSQTTDDPRFDRLFPDHPLSRLRRYLLTIRNSIDFDESLQQAEPFQM